MDEQTFIETVMPDLIEANKEELYVNPIKALFEFNSNLALLKR